MRLARAEVIEHAQQVFAEDGEIERSLVVLGLAVAACIPRRRLVARGKLSELRIPVLPPAADAVEEEEQLAFPRDGKRKARRRADEHSPHYSAFAPEMRTARAR